MRAEYIWDDVNYIHDNPYLPTARAIAAEDGLYRIWVRAETADYFPLTHTLFWIERRLWGTDPVGYHVLNVLLHALGGVLLWRVLKALEIPASIIQLQTGREVSRSVRDKKAGFTGPIYAQVRIKYEPIDHYTKKEVYDEIVAILENNNWEGEECNTCNSDYFSASLRQGDFPLLASVLIYSDENLVSIKIVNRNP